MNWIQEMNQCRGPAMRNEDITTMGERFATAVAELTDAQAHLERMRLITSEARNNECNALNKANEAQKRFDALVAEAKKSAPRETEWRRPSVSGSGDLVQT
jgi:hypothetical protein